MNMSRVKRLILLSAIAGLCLTTAVFGDWMKVADPPDVDKDEPGEFYDCWLVTAANMLAAAGYGTKSTVQARAEEIFEQLQDKYPEEGT